MKMNAIHVKEKEDGTLKVELRYGKTKLIFENVLVTPYSEPSDEIELDEIELTVSRDEDSE